jgi:hypothetical protein
MTHSKHNETHTTLRMLQHLLQGLLWLVSFELQSLPYRRPAY